MAAVNLLNPVLSGASPEAVRTASAMGLLSKPAPALTSAARTGNWSPPVIPAGATPEEAARLQSINRQGMTAASQYKAPARPAPTSGAVNYQTEQDESLLRGEGDIWINGKWFLSSQGQARLAELQKKKAGLNNSTGPSPLSKRVTNPSNLGYSQSYDPSGRGYRPISTISPQTAASLRAKFGTPSNLG